MVPAAVVWSRALERSCFCSQQDTVALTHTVAVFLCRTPGNVWAFLLPAHEILWSNLHHLNWAAFFIGFLSFKTTLYQYATLSSTLNMYLIPFVAPFQVYLPRISELVSVFSVAPILCSLFKGAVCLHPKLATAS